MQTTQPTVGMHRIQILPDISRLQRQHAQLVSGAHQFWKLTKQVLHRDDKQFKYCGI